MTAIDWLLTLLQSDAAREARLLLAEENVHVEDEHTGGQLNANWQIQKERKEKERQAKLKAAQPAGPQLSPAPAIDARNEVTLAASSANELRVKQLNRCSKEANLPATSSHCF